MTKIGIAGAGGRMGRTLIEACSQTDNAVLSTATERPDSSLVGADAGELAGIGKQDVSISSALDHSTDFDVLIDFTHPTITT